MNSYSVNICVATAGHDRYDKVAINKFPIIIIGDLLPSLSTDTIKNYIKENISSPDVLQSAEFFVSHVENDTIHKQTIPVSDVMDVK